MTIPERRVRKPRHRGRSIFTALVVSPLLSIAPGFAEEGEPIGFERTPPRLSMVDGEASFWRDGAEEWSGAQINTPLAAGDQLYTGAGANLEIQIGGRAFLRVAEQTQLTLRSVEPDYLQLRIAAGNVSLDLRELKFGQTLEVNTPNAAFTVEHAGYYRLTVEGEKSIFSTRRGGHAVVSTASDRLTSVDGGEQIVVTGTAEPNVALYAAPDLDRWDRWNYSRTEEITTSESSRYVSADVYGLSDLDRYGEWRQVPTYGAVWVPRGVAAGWAPYSNGRWIYDPFYGWSWVDYAPWGWAPFHYGRWVYVSGSWGWCPGPRVVRSYYAPALVAFYGGSGFSVGVSIGAPFGWVALGWGEPVVPWWGPAHFRRAPCWAGWGGPRYVNRGRVHDHRGIHPKHIHHHENARVRGGVVVVDRGDFGRRRVDPGRRRRFDADRMRPVHGDLPFRPDRDSMRAGDRPGRRPPRELLDRTVVSRREPRVARRPGNPFETENRRPETRRPDGRAGDRRPSGPTDPSRSGPATREARRRDERASAPGRDKNEPRVARGDDAFGRPEAAPSRDRSRSPRAPEVGNRERRRPQKGSDTATAPRDADRSPQPPVRGERRRSEAPRLRESADRPAERQRPESPSVSRPAPPREPAPRERRMRQPPTSRQRVQRPQPRMRRSNPSGGTARSGGPAVRGERRNSGGGRQRR